MNRVAGPARPSKRCRWAAELLRSTASPSDTLRPAQATAGLARQGRARCAGDGVRREAVRGAARVGGLRRAQRTGLQCGGCGCGGSCAAGGAAARRARRARISYIYSIQFQASKHGRPSWIRLELPSWTRCLEPTNRENRRNCDMVLPKA